jgi:hypothetical protein
MLSPARRAVRAVANEREATMMRHGLGDESCGRRAHARALRVALVVTASVFTAGAQGCAFSVPPETAGGPADAALDAPSAEASGPETGGGPADAALDASPAEASGPAAMTAPCADVVASCGPSPALVVRGHAEGLVGLEGATVAFAMGFVEPGTGVAGPDSNAVAGRTVVRGGAFESCVCMPFGADSYPATAAVVFRPGATTETAGDVAAAVFRQLFATEGDEGFGPELTAPPAQTDVENALSLVHRAPLGR